MSVDTWNTDHNTDASTCDSAWLWRVMQKEKNRDMIARLEDTLQRFIQDSGETTLPFPPRPPFHRKVCFEVAKRYGLDHRLEHHSDPDASSTHSDDKLRLVLIKTEHSTIPGSRLAEFAASPPPPSVQSSHQLPQTSSNQNNNKKPETNLASSNSQQNPKPATFLRRPRTADGKTIPINLTVQSSFGGSTPNTTALRGITEEDYQKARARIFELPSDNGTSMSSSAEQSIAKSLEQACRIRNVAKGPIEGSVGFERRRNRRNASANNNNSNNNNNNNNSHNDSRPQRRQQGDRGRKDPTRAGTSTDNGRGGVRSQTNARGGRDTRNTSNGSNGSNNDKNSGGSTQQSSNGIRRQPVYMVQQNNADLQDPDFDRRYDKWAVRREPPTQIHAQHPQPIHVPIFSQLLYPYAMQTAAHVHPNGIHVTPTPNNNGQTASAAQYASMMQAHAPSSALMFQQLGQRVGDYGASSVANISVGRNTNDQVGFDVSGRESIVGATTAAHALSHRTHHQAHHFQHQGLQNQVATQAPPAYGLDSTVDFPPLP